MKNIMAIIYQINAKGKKSSFQRRKEIIGYKDVSNNGQYIYEREGDISSFIIDKWGKSVIIIKRENETKVSAALKKHHIKHKKIKISIED